MRVLLDSNALIWWLQDDPRLARSGAVGFLNAAEDLAVSVVSTWELGIKAQLGKLRLPDRFLARLQALPIEIRSPDLRDGQLAASLPLLHRDPFDRMIVAQALNWGASLATGDHRLADYGVEVMRL